ncbi:MAG: 4Fe-4S binding protein [Eggerthellaceae bacterium]|nr:4Fe-4S binding protein [Eggerthellaceae bacterium]
MLAVSEECNYCCECLEACPVGAVNLAEGNIDNDLCTECGACQEACPIDAIFEPLY